MTEAKLHKNTNDEVDIEEAPVLKEIVKRIEEGKIENYRTNATESEFKMIVEICLKPMVSSKHWKLNHKQLEVSGMTTNADEALALLVLENNYKEWIEKAKGNTIDPKNRLTKYTNQGIRHNGTKKGWSLDGLKRFNEIFKEVKIQRSSELSRRRERNLMEEWERDDEDNNRRRTGREDEMPDLLAGEELKFVSMSDFDFE